MTQRRWLHGNAESLSPLVQHAVQAAQAGELEARQLANIAHGAVHIDSANGHCRLVIPEIPEREEMVDARPPPSPPPATLDIFGEDGPGDGGIFGESGAARTAARPSLLLSSLLLACTLWLVMSF